MEDRAKKIYFYQKKTKKVFYSNYNHSSYEIEERLVEIYYDVLDKNIKDDIELIT